MSAVNRIDMRDHQYLNGFLKERRENHPWVAEIVNSPIQSIFERQVNTRFPYQPLIKKNHRRVTIDRQYSSPFPFETLPEVEVGSQKPHYLVQIPWVPPKRKENFTQGVDRLKMILKALEEQTFDSSAESSKLEARKRVAVVIGINRVYSLDRNFNRDFQDFLNDAKEHLGAVEGVAFRVEAFLWSPWVSRHTHARRLRHHDTLPEKLYSIDKAYQIVKVLAPHIEHAGVIMQTYLNVSTHFKDLHSPKETLIQYQLIRDTIMHSTVMDQLFQVFREKTTYLHTLDDDFKSLKAYSRSRKGLLSHYDSAIDSVKRERGAYPSVLSTGYRASSEEHQIIRFGIDIEASVREKMTEILGSSIYYPEPNFMALIPPGRSPRDFSFQKADKSTHDAESRWFVLNGIAAGLIQPDRMRYLSDGAIITDIDGDWKKASHASCGVVDQRNIYKQRILTAIRSVKQSHLNDQVWSTNVYNSLGVNLGRNRMKGISKLKAIHNVFSPIVWTQDLYKKIGQPKYSFDKVNYFFNNYLVCIEGIMQNAEHLQHYTGEFVGTSVFRPLHETDSGKLLFQKRVSDLQGAQAYLIAQGYSQENINTVVRLAKVTGQVVHQKLQTVDRRVVISATLIHGVFQTYTLSSWRGLEPVTKDVAHDIAKAGNLEGYIAATTSRGTKYIRAQR